MREDGLAARGALTLDTNRSPDADLTERVAALGEHGCTHGVPAYWALAQNLGGHAGAPCHVTVCGLGLANRYGVTDPERTALRSFRTYVRVRAIIIRTRGHILGPKTK